MQLIRTIQIGLLVAVFGLLSLALPAPADAACEGDCSVSTCRICFGSGRYRTCEQVYCSSCSGRCEIRFCPPGTFPISGGNGCRDIGPVNNCPCGTKPSGVCNSCEPEPPPPPPCDANSWGAWSACSVSCGGGTRTRTNACGTVQSQGCNPQPCQDAWWQVKDGDTSSNGNLTSDLSPGNYFGLPGPGGFPGVAAFGGSSNLTALGRFSAPPPGWNAQSPNAVAKIFDYAYFANQAPGGTVFNAVSPADASGSITSGGTPDAEGYYWYKYEGGGVGLSIDRPMDLGGRKVILFVDSSDLLINARINLDDGAGFFLAIVGKNSTGAKGNIIVSPAVGGGAFDLEGIYVADGRFETGFSGTALNVRGSVTGYDGIAMQRDLAGSGNTNPSEFYEYAPDQILLFPKKLSTRKINWKEVAP